MISRSISPLSDGMSSGFESRSSIRHHAPRNSGVTGAVAMAGFAGSVFVVWNSSRLRNSRTMEISSFRETARQGASRLASFTLVTVGRSTEIRR